MVELKFSRFGGNHEQEIPITITPAVENGNQLIWLNPFEPIDLTATIDDVKELNKDFEIAVLSLANKIDDDTLSFADLPQTILVDLARTGRSALTTVFGINGIQILRRQIQAIENRKTIPVLVVKSDICYLPWEVLFWDDTDNFRIVGNTHQEKLFSVLNGFWALNYIIARADTHKINTHTSQLGSLTRVVSSVDVSVVIDNSIDYAKDEEEYLSNYVSTLSDFSYSRFIYQANFKAELNEFLHESRRCIVHIACHAEPDGRSANRSHLRIDGQIFEIRDLTQRAELMTALFIFLNACSTGIRVPTQTLQFVQSLRRRKGVPNVIAAEFVIETYIAKEYATHFYEHFLRGNTLGESIYYARRQSLTSTNDDVGIISILFYSLYGDPYFQIRLANSPL